MLNNFYKYLSVNKKLSLPNIGSFTINQQSAQLDFINKTLHAPLFLICFDTDTNKIESSKLNDLSNEIENNCKNNGSVYLRGIGNLKKENANYFFEPESSVQNFFPDIIVEKIVRKNAQHTIRVGEEERTNTEMQEFFAEAKIKKNKWWAYAIVLTLLGIIALIIYNIIR
ncbi:MAG: hypothetical protein ACR2FN_09595 [Chitinophagaceae bacterium]